MPERRNLVVVVEPAVAAEQAARHLHLGDVVEHPPATVDLPVAVPLDVVGEAEARRELVGEAEVDRPLVLAEVGAVGGDP